MTTTSQDLKPPAKAGLNQWPEYAPTIWSGMTLGAWWQTLSQEGFAVDPRWYGRAGLMFLSGALNSALAVADRCYYGTVGPVHGRLEEAVFIIGHWRTGTTFMHELLAAHRDFAAPTTYQVFAPAHFRLSQKWMAPLIGKAVPAIRPQDNTELGILRPQEDEFAINALGVKGPTRAFGFPRRHLASTDSLFASTADVGGTWKDPWLTFARRFASTVPNHRPLFKSPGHTARIGDILDALPNARFLHLVRDPYAVYASTMKMMGTLMSQQGFQSGGYDTSALSRFVLSNLNDVYDRFDVSAPRLKPDRHIVLRFEDFVRDPLARVEDCLFQLGMAPIDPASREQMEMVVARHKSQARERVEPALASDIRNEIARAWKPYFEAFGYEAHRI